MSDESDNFQDELRALADGELGPARAAEVLAQLADQQEALRWVREQQRLSAATKRIAGYIDAPQSLRNTIAAIATANLKTDAEPSSVRLGDGPIPITAITTPAASRYRFVAAASFVAALAAGLLIGVFATRSFWQPHRTNTFQSWPVPVIATGEKTSPLAPNLVVAAGRIHANCSRLAEGLHNARFEKTDADLAASVRTDLAGVEPYPDLTSVDFHFVGAGPCPPMMPGDDSPVVSIESPEISGCCQPVRPGKSRPVSDDDDEKSVRSLLGNLAVPYDCLGNRSRCLFSRHG